MMFLTLLDAGHKRMFKIHNGSWSLPSWSLLLKINTNYVNTLIIIGSQIVVGSGKENNRDIPEKRFKFS